MKKRIFWEMFENQKRGWLSGYFRRNNASIDNDALELLLDLVENNTMSLQQTAAHLVLFIKDRRITVDDIHQYVYHAKEENIFTLYEAMMHGNVEQALEIAEKLMYTTDVSHIISGLSWQFERFFTVYNLKESGVAEDSIFRSLQELTGKVIKSKLLQKSLMRSMKERTYSQCVAVKQMLCSIEEKVRAFPTSLHKGLLQQLLLYSAEQKQIHQ